MELEDAKELALELMSDYGLYYWKFKFDYAKIRFGCCDGRKRIISLSKPLVLINDDEVVENVILHEIAHALVGNSQGHNKVFQQQAEGMGCIFTGRYAYDNVIGVPKNVVAKCPNCSREVRRYRMPKRQFSCGKCSSGVFNPEYLLVFERK